MITVRGCEGAKVRRCERAMVPGRIFRTSSSSRSVRPAATPAPSHLRTFAPSHLRTGSLMRVLNTEQMRDADRRTIEEIGLPSIVLMENAGRQVAAAMESAFAPLASKRVAVLCGRGNNGGDGLVVARVLLERSIDVGVYLFASAAEVRGEARTNLDVLGALGVDVIEISGAPAWELHGIDRHQRRRHRRRVVRDGAEGPAHGLDRDRDRRPERRADARRVDRPAQRPVGR